MDTVNLLKIGLKGTHVLFDNDTIRKAFLYSKNMQKSDSSEGLDNFRSYIHDFVQIEDIDVARDFLKSIPLPAQYVIILSYFELLFENLDDDHIPVH